MCRVIVSALFLFTLSTLGCRKTPTELEQLSRDYSSAVATVSDPRSQPIEMFVFDNSRGDLRGRVFEQLQSLTISTLPGGSLVHLIQANEHRHIISVHVPYGPPRVRTRNPTFGQDVSHLRRFYGNDKDNIYDVDLGVPDVAETVRNLRQTDFACRIVLVGDGVFASKDYPAFSMTEGLYPSFSLIGHPQSPFVTTSELPAGSFVSWLTPHGQWGRNDLHRKDISRFWRVYFSTIGGRIVRFTSDPVLAFSFAEPHLQELKLENDGEPRMRESQAPIELGPSRKDQPVKKLPVEHAKASFSEKGSLRFQIEMNGGDVGALSGEAISISLVYDGSGSMASHIHRVNATILKIAEQLPGLVKELEISVQVHRNTGTSRFPLTKLRDKKADNGESYSKLEDFLTTITATDGDAKMFNMLAEGVRTLQAATPENREFMVVVADFVDLSETNIDAQQAALREVQRWARDSGNDRRAIAMFCGDAQSDMASFFQKLGSVNDKSFYTRSADSLVRSLLEAAVPVEWNMPNIKF